jgi:hypothetical protein
VLRCRQESSFEKAATLGRCGYAFAMAGRHEGHDEQPPLPNFRGASLSVGTFLAGLEQKILHNRPPAAVVVEEHQRADRAMVDGLSLEQTDEPVVRPEPPDTSGARL